MSPLAGAQRSIAVTQPDAPPAETSVATVAAQALVDAYRMHGYRFAALDPLDEAPKEPRIPLPLEAASFGLDDSSPTRTRLAGEWHERSGRDLVRFLQDTYCGTLGLSAGHLRDPEQQAWLYERLERRRIGGETARDDALVMLATLTAVEAYEQFHRDHHGAFKQFSLNGSDSIVVLLEQMIRQAPGSGVREIVLGMPHRGRLNLMVNALGVPAERVLSFYTGSPDRELLRDDIKDHAAFVATRVVGRHEVDILLAHNPSHLESVSPVVCGMARSRQDQRRDGTRASVLPILIHGDASFTGQGIVSETLNQCRTRGYGVGGTVHVILNNQIGSTVSHPRDARSTPHCADLARGFDVPILHVNADDPEAVQFAAELAVAYRSRFLSDIVIDHIGYRRDGHFVGDDPMYTQPAMQRTIRNRRSAGSLYAQVLKSRGWLEEGESGRLQGIAMAKLAEAKALSLRAPAPAVARPPDVRAPVDTTVPVDHLLGILRRLAEEPREFELHPRVRELAAAWRTVAGENERGLVDWRLAENLAYGSLLAIGFNIRVTGLDIGRGTFGHRQHVWHDQAAPRDWERLHVPLRGVAESQGTFSIFEAPLSEEAVLGFEYGYSLQCGRDLVVWEAQFGDFVNNAQVIIDQYLASGRSKWGYRSGMVLMLPHGYDGWGPEHSSAYLGRFLALCVEGNLRVAVPSTAGQLYHLLRRQALDPDRVPLIVMTHKPAFLGHAAAYSRIAALAAERFQPILGEPAPVAVDDVTHVVLASGKVYYDLAAGREASGLRDVPVIRIEELHPFPVADLRRRLAAFPRLRTVAWAQEEARNHGAWPFVRDELERALPPGVTLSYAGRPPAAASAVADAAVHEIQRRDLVAAALGIPRDTVAAT